nr:CoB--CoM heterodisulfide reductase iron-sulfur subunit A family protein [Candidatus Njordarchaeota archaeon]
MTNQFRSSSGNQVKQKACLVIGAGIAGMQVSIDLASQGFKVYLVEQQPSIGGHMAQLDKTFPTLDCSACILTPKMVEVSRHPNVALLAYSEVTSIAGKAGDFVVKLVMKPRLVRRDRCTGCGTCARHCPVEAPNEFDMGLGVRKAIYVPFPQAEPSTYTIDEKNCIKCKLCEQVCQAGAVDFNQKPKEVEFHVGAIVVCTGFDFFNIKEHYKNIGYGKYDNVITSLEFERLINASGPTSGAIIRLSDGRVPKKIAFVNCIGSRDESKRVDYCSRVCCMYSTKNAILATEHVEGCEPTIYFIDLRAFGKGFEEFYRSAEKNYGVKFIKGRVGEVIQDPESKNLYIRAEDTSTGEVLTNEHDLVVLSPGLIPSRQSPDFMSWGIRVERDSHDFYKSIEATSLPVDTSIKGIYVCGVAECPKDIPDSVAQASAAAMRASIILTGAGTDRGYDNEKEAIA